MNEKDGRPPRTATPITGTDSIQHIDECGTCRPIRSPECAVIPPQRRTDWQRKQFMNQARHKRRTSAELDVRAGTCRAAGSVVEVDGDFYAATGLVLGWDERVAAGRALLGWVA